MRAYHDQALIDEFRRRGIDAAAVSDGRCISFAQADTLTDMNPES